MKELTKEEKQTINNTYCDFCGQAITKKQYFESGCIICEECKNNC